MSEAQRKDLCAYGHVTTPIVNTAIQETWFINLFNQLNTFFSHLQGSLCNDYCVVNCCGPCVLCQLARELKSLQRWIANQLTTTRNHCFGTGTRSLNFDSTVTMWKWHTVAYVNKMQLIKEIVCLNQFIYRGKHVRTFYYPESDSRPWPLSDGTGRLGGWLIRGSWDMEFLEN